jgi:hypothetical protein
MKQFTATVEARRTGGGLAIRLPFDPASVWGDRARYDLTGTVDGCKVRGKLIARDNAYFLDLGPAWCRDSHIASGARVTVALDVEGPQVSAMPPDIAAAFEAEPDAGRFFQSLPTFYRKNFMRWIDQAKRPETRANRIAEMVATLKAGKRERT